jgi:phage terminase small subunit
MRTPRQDRSAALTPKQRLFVDEYLVDLSATKAAIRAGYSARTAHSCGPRLLENAGVAKAIGEAMAQRAERTRVTTDDVVATIEETVRRCAQTEPVRDARGNVIPGLYTFDAKNVLRGCELLGKHLGIFKERVEHTGPMMIERTIVHVHRTDGVPSAGELADD